MDIIEQERENYLTSENNTAQDTLETSVEALQQSLSILNINIALYGSLDLAFLGDQFPNLREIRFSPGKIVELRHVPPGITRLECPGNLLTEIAGDDLPGTLLALDLHNNYLRGLQLESVGYLEELNVNGNRVERLENLPTSLVRLYCNDNELTWLDLKGLDALEELHVSNNTGLVRVDHLPVGIRAVESENCPFTFGLNRDEGSDGDSDEDGDGDGDEKGDTENARKIERKIGYLEALQRYFERKQQYEEGLMKKRRTVYQRAPTKRLGRLAVKKVRANCIYCARPVGTRFYTNSTGHFAVCGDTAAPCALNVKLVRGSFGDNEADLYIFHEHLEERKENIIRQKLDTLFQYYSDDESARIFKKVLEKYNDTNGVFTELKARKDELLYNEARVEQTRKKTLRVHEIMEEIGAMLREFETTDNMEVLTTAMEIYVRDLLPERDNLQRLRYEVSEMEEDVLRQWPVAMNKLEYVFGDEPEVVHFKGM